MSSIYSCRQFVHTSYIARVEGKKGGVREEEWLEVSLKEGEMALFVL